MLEAKLQKLQELEKWCEKLREEIFLEFDIKIGDSIIHQGKEHTVVNVVIHKNDYRMMVEIGNGTFIPIKRLV